MRWQGWLVGAITVGIGLIGCKQTTFVEETPGKKVIIQNGRKMVITRDKIVLYGKPISIAELKKSTQSPKGIKQNQKKRENTTAKKEEGGSEKQSPLSSQPSISYQLKTIEEKFSNYREGTTPPFGEWEGRNVVVTQYFQANNIPGNVLKLNGGIICNYKHYWKDFNLTADYKTFTIGQLSVDLRVDEDRYYQINFFDRAVEVEAFYNPFRNQKIFSKKVEGLGDSPTGWQKLLLSRQGKEILLKIDGIVIGKVELPWIEGRGVRLCFEGNGVEGTLLDNLRLVGERGTINR